MPALDGLNPPQQEAVRTVDGPLLILAGPGSGKTRVIVHRVAYLLEQGVEPYNVLAVTFTNKAAREMRERLAQLVGKSVERLTVGTFHATCARWLRRDIHHLGRDARFAIYDENDQVDLMKAVCRELEIDDKRFPPRMILHEISSAKSNLVDAEAYEKTAESRWRQLVARAYKRYQARLAENRALDFDDLLLYAVRLFEEHPEVLAHYQRRFRYVLVDEFQDTNIVQYRLVRLLTEKHRNICVVGDPDQSIYGWRHADIRNILNFEHDYPDLKVVVLDQNYRSTQRIIELAHAVISTNQLRKEKNLWTENPEGGAVTLFEAFDEREEAQFVVRELERLTAAGSKLGGIAVMYRTNAQSRAVEDAFVRYGIPYRLVGGVRFYERREVKDVLAYLRLLANPHDSVSLQRIVNVPPRGLGAKTIAELGRWAREMKISPYEALERADPTPDPSPARGGETRGRGDAETRGGETRGRGDAETRGGEAVPADSRMPFAPRAREAIRSFVALMDELRQLQTAMPLPTLIDELLERSGYSRYTRDGTEEGDERWANVVELRNKARDYEDLGPEVALQRFLEDVSLVQDVDSLQGESEAATLITLHAAKGLEFPYVFILGLEEGLCPHVRSLDDPAQLEEERRLFYVGITRAMEGLYLLHASRRFAYGGGTMRDPSRFLSDIPPELLKVSSPRSASYLRDDQSRWSRSRPSLPSSAYRLDGADPKSQVPEPALSLPKGSKSQVSGVKSRTATTFQKGDSVSHPAFGEGIVIESQIVGGDEQVSVLFKGQPTPKKLSLSFAPLQRA